jgi:hypothetical protein
LKRYGDKLALFVGILFIASPRSPFLSVYK